MVLNKGGITSIRGLKNYNITENSGICAYKPLFQDAFSQNVFRESESLMANKYVIISNFCLQKLNSSEKQELKPYSANIASCSGNRERMVKLYNTLLEN